MTSLGAVEIIMTFLFSPPLLRIGVIPRSKSVSRSHRPRDSVTAVAEDEIFTDHPPQGINQTSARRMEKRSGPIPSDLPSGMLSKT